MIDPLSALSVACNILQLVELGGRIVSDTLEVYESATGSTIDNDILQDTSQRLQGLLDDLQSSTSSGATRSDRNIHALSVKCRKVSEELIELLDLVRANGRGKKWASLTAAFHQLRKGDKIKKLAERLDSLQSELSLHLLGSLTNGQSNIAQEIALLRSQCRRLDLDRIDQITRMQQELLDAINSVALGNLSWNVATDAQLRSANIQSASTSITGALASTHDIQLEIRVLQSIKFPTIHLRYDDIARAHGATFQWVFEDNGSSEHNPACFRNWLRGGHGVFWIKGKPGSGKSTLMKYISAQAATRQHLDVWASGQKLVTANYYFWNAGNRLQKSQEGLVRSLLFEILRKCPEMILPVWSILADGDSEVVEVHWRWSDLVHAFTRVLEQLQFKVKFCFFVDGLDEYGGQDHDSLIKLIQSMAVGEQVKFCVSSRPWNEFEDAFGQFPDRQLRLEVHTTRDISRYVEETFEENTNYRRVKSRDSRYTELISQVVERADGVFLWVFLAVQSLVKGMTNADSIAKLESRLQSLPPTLDEFFRQMLLSVEPEYKAESKVTILTALEAEGSLDLMIYSILDDDLDLPSILAAPRLDSDEIAIRHEIATKRMNARSKGILEVKVKFDSEGPFFSRHVDFLHRTARDFLNTPDMRKMLNDSESVRLSIAQRLVRTYIGVIRRAPEVEIYNSGQTNMITTMHDMFVNAERVEALSHETMIKELDACEAMLRANDSKWLFRRKRTRFLSLAATHGLLLYVRYRLDKEPQLLNLYERPVLDCVLQNIDTEPRGDEGTITPIPDLTASRQQAFLIGNRDFIFDDIPLRSDMVEFLLQRGASPDQRYRDQTVWERFVKRLNKGTNAVPDICPGDLVDVLEMLIMHGARRDTKIETSRSVTEGPAVMKSGRRLRRVDVIYEQAIDICAKVLEANEVDHLQRLKPAHQQAGIMSWLSDGLWERLKFI